MHCHHLMKIKFTTSKCCLSRSCYQFCKPYLVVREDNIGPLLLKCQTIRIQTYKSTATIVDPQEVVHNPVAFLNSLNPSQLPCHAMRLKIGAPATLLRSMEPPRHCNGILLAVKKLMSHFIEATIITRYGMGEDVYIPRIPVTP